MAAKLPESSLVFEITEADAEKYQPQAQALSNGINYIQGYYLHRPDTALSYNFSQELN